METNKNSLIFKKLNGDGLLKTSGFALDLGFGEGKEVFGLASIGFEIDCVEISDLAIKNLEERIKDNNEYKINIYNISIENFEIKEGKYDCIIASNSLPFLDSKEKVKNVVTNISKGLKKDGCFYLTFFGNKDEWKNKERMNFFDYEEIRSFLDSLEIKFYHSVIEEGYGKTMKGELKYWNIFKFIYTKNS